MKILVVEDGQQAAGSLARTLCRAAPGSEYLCACLLYTSDAADE